MALLIFTGGCGANNDIANQTNEDIEGLKIVTSISILADLIENVVGNKGHVVYIVPRTDNPEDHEILPSELQKIINSDADTYIGLMKYNTEVFIKGLRYLIHTSFPRLLIQSDHS